MDDSDKKGLLKKARTQSRARNETFNEGEVGRVLGLVGDAEDRVGSLRTLDSVLSSGKGSAQAEKLTEKNS